MKTYPWLLVTSSLLLIAGCHKHAADNQKGSVTDEHGQAVSAGNQDEEAAIKTNLAKLSPEDRKAAEEQRFCAIANGSRLGSMGVPVKLVLQDQPVFLCCKGCTKKAQSNPDQTVAKVKELKAKFAAPGRAEKQTGPVPLSRVTLLRVPNRGIQPQAMVDAAGVVHLIYFGGDAKAGDIFYVRSEDGKQFSEPIRVNSQAGSAIAVGNIRGAHLALGKKNRVHVAWMGSSKAQPQGPGDSAPMLYARLDDAGTAFEPQRNLIQKAPGLDGGGSVAADDAGNVYVAWHAPKPGGRGEDNRCVWLARSSDDGKTFAREERANADPTGACGCCGMRAFADKKGTLFVLYRSASQTVHRDMHLLVSTNRGSSFQGEKIHPWNVGACPMSSMAFGETGDAAIGAWETGGQVYFSPIDAGTGKVAAIAAPGHGMGRKHPVVAGNAAGETILAWTEGMGWDRGGSLAWQVFDRAVKPTEQKGTASGVPTWSLVAVFARADGGFTIVY